MLRSYAGKDIYIDVCHTYVFYVFCAYLLITDGTVVYMHTKNVLMVVQYYFVDTEFNTSL